MGIPHADIILENTILKRKLEVNALVDSGSVFMTVPQHVAVPGQFNEVADGTALKVRAVRLEVARRAGMRVAEGEEPGPADLTDRAVRNALRALLTERHGASEWEQRKLEAERPAAGTPVSLLERAQRISQGEPQVADLAPLYRGIVERIAGGAASTVALKLGLSSR